MAESNADSSDDGLWHPSESSEPVSEEISDEDDEAEPDDLENNCVCKDGCHHWHRKTDDDFDAYCDAEGRSPLVQVGKHIDRRTATRVKASNARTDIQTFPDMVKEILTDSVCQRIIRATNQHGAADPNRSLPVSRRGIWTLKMYLCA